MTKKILLMVLVFGGVGVGLVSLLKGIDPDEERSSEAVLRVVTTTTMVTDMVQVIGGERVDVNGIMGAGVDPHSYQVTFQDTAALRKADLIFYSGLHLEGRMQDVLGDRKTREGGVFALTDGIDKEKLLKPQEELQAYHDPHVWGDPLLWSGCVETVVKALSDADPAGAEGYVSRAEVYLKELKALHEWATRRVTEVHESQRVLVTSHDAFFYFGKAFGFEVKGLQGVSTNSESGLRDRADLVQFIKDRKLKMIFPESSVNAKGIKAVAEEAGVRVSSHELYSDAMGEPGDHVSVLGESYDKGTYIGMIKHNVNTIVEGLK